VRLVRARASPGRAAPDRRRCHPPSGCGGGSASTALASRPGRDIAAARWRTTSRRGGLCTLPGSRLPIRACPWLLSSGRSAPRTLRRPQMLRTARMLWPIGLRSPVPPCVQWPRQQPARPAGTNKEPRRRWPVWAPLRRLLLGGAGYEMACDGGPKGSLPRSSRSPGNVRVSTEISRASLEAPVSSRLRRHSGRLSGTGENGSDERPQCYSARPSCRKPRAFSWVWCPHIWHYRRRNTANPGVAPWRKC